MSPWLVAPLVVTAAGLLVALGVPRNASPRAGAWVLACAAVATVAGLASGLALLAVAGAAQVHAVTDVMGWCRDLYPGGGRFGGWIGLAAAAALVVAATRVAAVIAGARRQRHAIGAVNGLRVVAADGPVAFAVPGRHGGVVVGDGLLSLLDADETAAVLAHERAHLRLHHHRFVVVALACAAALPVLAPVARRVRFATERWADEVAAAEVGSRLVVARAVARAGLMRGAGGPAGAMAFGGGQTVARVRALMDPPSAPAALVPVAVGLAGLLVTLLGSSVQVHHLAEFVASLCRP